MTSDNDIVTRLRDCTCVPHGEICREAANEIERLRAERDEARRELKESEKLLDEYQRESADRTRWEDSNDC